MSKTLKTQPYIILIFGGRLVYIHIFEIMNKRQMLVVGSAFILLWFMGERIYLMSNKTALERHSHAQLGEFLHPLIFSFWCKMEMHEFVAIILSWLILCSVSYGLRDEGITVFILRFVGCLLSGQWIIYLVNQDVAKLESRVQLLLLPLRNLLRSWSQTAFSLTSAGNWGVLITKEFLDKREAL